MQDSTNKPKAAITDSMYWWLGPGRPFVINDEYSIELLEIRRSSGTAKIKITNLKTKQEQVVEG